MALQLRDGGDGSASLSAEPGDAWLSGPPKCRQTLHILIDHWAAEHERSEKQA
jgi:hypothetical protein